MRKNLDTSVDSDDNTDDLIGLIQLHGVAMTIE